MDQVQRKVQDAVDKVIRHVDRDNLRGMQEKAYQCATACYNARDYDMEHASNCVQRCTEPMQRAQNYMQNEITSLQNRLQRCSMDCQDSVRDRVGPSPTEEQMSQARVDLEKCVMSCADKTVDSLPVLVQRMGAALASGKM